MSAKAATQFALLDRDLRALEFARLPFDGTPDPLELMNRLARWPDPPAYDERWTKKLAAACEIAAAYAKLAHNYKLEVERARFTGP